MEIICCNTNDKIYQSRLNKLLTENFLDFQFWYDLELWDENYESYSISDGEEIVSNICVYKTKIIFNGKIQLALSLGAVATKKEYRGRGFSRNIMEHIFRKYKNVPMYLSANENVIDFYKKFGFKQVYEKSPIYFVSVDSKISAKKLKYDDNKVINYVYNRVNYSTKLDCLNTAPINMFHIHLGYIKSDIYELSDIETMIVANQCEEILKIKAMYSLKKISLNDLIENLPFSGVDKIEFGFMPDFEGVNFEMEYNEADPWFVKNINCDLGEIKFPELSLT